jgi:hypothetical protein
MGLELKQGFVDLEYSKAKQNFIDQLCMYETNQRVPNLSHFHLEILTGLHYDWRTLVLLFFMLCCI